MNWLAFLIVVAILVATVALSHWVYRRIGRGQYKAPEALHRQVKRLEKELVKGKKDE